MGSSAGQYWAAFLTITKSDNLLSIYLSIYLRLKLMSFLFTYLILRTMYSTSLYNILAILTISIQ